MAEEEERQKQQIFMKRDYTIDANITTLPVRSIHDDADESCQPEVDTLITVARRWSTLFVVTRLS